MTQISKKYILEKENIVSKKLVQLKREQLTVRQVVQGLAGLALTCKGAIEHNTGE